MFNNFKKFKQPKKSKEIRREESRQRAIVREQFYPWLKENAKTVQDARNMLLMFSTAIQSQFDTLTLKKREELSSGPLSDMGVDTLIINQDAPEMKLLTILGSEKVSTAKALVDGLMKAIDHSVSDELKERTLDSLKVDEQILE